MSPPPEDHLQFRATREAELVEPYGWLTLRGYHWLAGQPSAVEGLPGRWWADADQTEAHLQTTAADGLTRDGAPVDGTHTFTAAEYARSVWVEYGDVQIELLRRGGRLAIRLRAASSPDREGFAGVPTFDYDPVWRVAATFIPTPDASPVTVDTIRPDLQQVANPFGVVIFTAGGQPQRLAVTKGKYGWGVQFHDPTNGVETERWRQLHFDPPTGDDGAVVLDFNRALNMWFAFTDHATCPAPIAGNEVTVPVTAGERRFRSSSGG